MTTATCCVRDVRSSVARCQCSRIMNSFPLLLFFFKFSLRWFCFLFLIDLFGLRHLRRKQISMPKQK